MSGLRSVATAIAMIVFGAPLLAQSATTAQDTTALARLPVSITAVTSVIVHEIRPTVPTWVTSKTTTMPVARLPATWSDGEASHTTATTMMIVGGAGLLVGAVISGKPRSMIMIGGALLTLVGLWRYAK